MSKPDKPEEEFNKFLDQMEKEIKPRVIIVRNSAKCLKCGDQVESRNRHDFRSCSCGSVSVDGGKEYLRRCGNPEDYEDTSICKEANVKPFKAPKGAQRA
jgi:hypothetical protein